MKWLINGQYVEPSDSGHGENEMGQIYKPTVVQSELREQAYNSDPCVPWDGSMLTVTEAAQLWQYYAAEGNTDKTDELTALIAAAKAEIRERWPEKEE